MSEDTTMVQSDVVHGGTPSEGAPEAGHSCPQCAKATEDDEMAYAFLLALMPVITLTLFGNMGLL